MSVNLSDNKDALIAAWHSVVDDKSPTNWAVFGYDGQSNVLKVVSTGCKGLEEMIDELSSGMIMYAFCRVIDIKTTLPKCLLINWQGECAPILRKGTCANHIRDVERLLKGAHVTMTARCEEDVEVDLIMEKLSRATGSAYKFNETRGENGGRTAPVGTTYRRVIPEQEINATERDQFWQREEIEEKQRLEQERAKWEQNRRKLEEEVRRREEKENELREKQISAKDNVIAVQRQAEQRAEDIKNLRNQRAENERNNDVEDEPKSRSDELRKQRSKEAQQLIAQRTINARAVFEQNTCAGQTRKVQVPQHKGNHVGAAKKVFETNQRKEVATEVTKEPDVVKKPPEPIEIPRNSVPETPQTKPVPQPEKVIQPQEEAVNQIQQVIEEKAAPVVEETTIPTKEEEKNPTKDQPVMLTAASLEEAENELYGQLENEQFLYLDPNNEGMTARALYDYQAADDTEITFDPGDIITHIDAIDEGWWQGLAPDGTYGLFPANHVEVIEYTSS